MSIGIALVGTDGIILASDSRKMFLDGGCNDNAQKVFELTPRVGLISTGGHSGYQEWLVDKSQWELHRVTGKIQAGAEKAGTGNLPFDFEEIVESFVHIVRPDYDFITSKASRYGLSHLGSRLIFIIAGYNFKGKPCIAHLDSSDANYPFAPDYIASPPRCVSGISEVWHYWVQQFEEQGLKTEEMSIKSLKVLVTFMITETAKANNLVGGNPQIAVIRQGKDIERVDNQEIEELRNRVANLINIRKVIRLLLRG